MSAPIEGLVSEETVDDRKRSGEGGAHGEEGAAEERERETLEAEDVDQDGGDNFLEAEDYADGAPEDRDDHQEQEEEDEEEKALDRELDEPHEDEVDDQADDNGEDDDELVRRASRRSLVSQRDGNRPGTGRTSNRDGTERDDNGEGDYGDDVPAEPEYGNDAVEGDERDNVAGEGRHGDDGEEKEDGEEEEEEDEEEEDDDDDNNDDRAGAIRRSLLNLAGLLGPEEGALAAANQPDADHYGEYLNTGVGGADDGADPLDTYRSEDRSGPGDDGRQESLAQLLQDADHERRMLMQINGELLQRVYAHWKRDPHSRPAVADEKGSGAPGGGGGEAVSADHLREQHVLALAQANKLIESVAQRRSSLNHKIDRLNEKLDAQDEQATELCESFKAFKRAIARGAEHSRTGQPIKFKRILALEAAEEEKDKAVETVRLKNIHYLNQLARLEQDLTRREDRSDGLHLIDFEQLKIENQTLNEKIEERNDELHKLLNKTTSTVQILTHVKEKLTFVRTENAELKAVASSLDQQVVAMRNRLSRAKQERDNLRRENTVQKHKRGFVGSDLLVADFERTRTDADQLEARLKALRARQAELVNQARALSGSS